MKRRVRVLISAIRTSFESNWFEIETEFRTKKKSYKPRQTQFDFDLNQTEFDLFRIE